MTQQIRPYSVAEESLRISEMAQGTPAMGTGVRPGANAFDQDPYTKVSMNPQAAHNERYMKQSAGQNLSTMVPQGQAAAMGQARAEIARQSGKEHETQLGLARTVAEIMYANDAGTRTFQLGAPGAKEEAMLAAAQQRIIADGSNASLPMASNNFAA